MAWEFANGPIPKGKCVLHRCDNPSCCNPDHLFLGSHKDNTQDAIRKGRFKFNLPKPKLTSNQVEEIRTLYGSVDYTQSELAEKFGVHQSQISRIVRRLRW
jgi:predicted XRE-type DNA-binding protein